MHPSPLPSSLRKTDQAAFEASALPVEYELTGSTARRWSQVLKGIVERPTVHARWLNTLSMLEYIGCRKMVKALHASSLDIGLLHHICEEAGHAWRFKKLSETIGPGGCKSYDDADLLHGAAARNYLCQLDRQTSAYWLDSAVPSNELLPYWTVTCLVEWRAMQVYALYEDILQTTALGISLRGILQEEQRHLAEIKAALLHLAPQWQRAVPVLVQLETLLMNEWLQCLERDDPPHGARSQ